MSDFEKLQAALTEIGIPFELTDDSEESEIHEDINTAIVLKDTSPTTDLPYFMTFLFFRRDGSFKGIDII